MVGESIQVTASPGQSPADVLLALAGMMIDERGFQESDFPSPTGAGSPRRSEWSHATPNETKARGGKMRALDLAIELQKIYDCEINVEIGWLWDSWIEVHPGDRMNGFLAEENVGSVGEILPWLQEAIAHFYPDSGYARSLDAEVREGAARRIFLPPQAGAQVRCPHAHRYAAHIAVPRTRSRRRDPEWTETPRLLQFSPVQRQIQPQHVDPGLPENAELPPLGIISHESPYPVR
jgi:hypothetical protein